jgi:predicted O-methyltransferase YrrM
MSLDQYLQSKNTQIVEGYSQQIPQQIIDLIAISKYSKNAMEIGFNAGHSAEVFLSNNPEMHLTSFDIGDHIYVKYAKEYIDYKYPGRHTLILGNSTQTIPKYISENPGKIFDFIFVDGGHQYPVPAIDLDSCAKLSNKDTVVAIDDIINNGRLVTHWTVGPTLAWRERVDAGKIVQHHYNEYMTGRGMSWGKYVQPDLQTDRNWYNGLLYHMQDALIESGISSGVSDRPNYALFAKKYIQQLKQLREEKKYDYCFIGSLKSSPERRKWVVDFVKEHFTEQSIFVNTDSGVWESLGSFDKTGEIVGFNPKEQADTQSRHAQYRVVSENLPYFQTMAQSKFVLCPAGDGPWSFRFYETLLCGAIPVVDSWHYTYRTVHESTLSYKYFLLNEKCVFNQSDVEINDSIVAKFHCIN